MSCVVTRRVKMRAGKQVSLQLHISQGDSQGFEDVIWKLRHFKNTGENLAVKIFSMRNSGIGQTYWTKEGRISAEEVTHLEYESNSRFRWKVWLAFRTWSPLTLNHTSVCCEVQEGLTFNLNDLARWSVFPRSVQAKFMSLIILYIEFLKTVNVLLGCDAVQFGRLVRTFHTNLLPPSSEEYSSL